MNLVVTAIIGAVIFLITFLLSFFVFLVAIVGSVGRMFKKCTATGVYLFPSLFWLLFPCFCLAAELALYHYAPHAWGVAYFFIAVNVLYIVIPYFAICHSAIFTGKRIYRFTKFLFWETLTYEDVIGYVMKKTAYTRGGRFGQDKVLEYEMEVYFRNGAYTDDTAKNKTNSRLLVLKQLLESHHCRRNGRLKEKNRAHR